MRRFPSLLALVLILALDECSLDSPGCGSNCAFPTHDTQQNPEVLGVKQSFVFSDATCSSSCHAHVTAAWSLQPQTHITGDVLLEARITCPADSSCCNESYVTAPGANKVIDLAPTNAKNLCNDNAQEIYTVTLTNNTNEDLISPRITLTCPTLGASGFVTGPSPVRVR